MSRAFALGSVAALTLVSLSCLPARAQAPAAAGQSSLGGPQIAGVCLLSQQAVFANAKVGVAATTRLRELTQQADTELTGERGAIEADAKTLDGQRAGLKAADLQQKQTALNGRVQALQQKAQQRNREMEATREQAMARIAGEAQPVIAQAYKAHNCGLLVDRTAILGGNMAGDLTAEVVRGLDAKITTITFERAALPAQAAGGR